MLESLEQELMEIKKKYFSENKLIPIPGNGQTKNPKYMFLFINPTARNISSDPAWQGPRFPFCGTKQIWRIFYRAGLFDDRLMEKVENGWSVAVAKDVLFFLTKRSFYFTNLVKLTGEDATLPDAQKINLFLPLLQKEIEIVQPENIITFGLLPFEHLTHRKIKLGEYYQQVKAKNKLLTNSITINIFSTKIIPCYFPIGRGNPKRAVEMLRMLS